MINTVAIRYPAVGRIPAAGDEWATFAAAYPRDLGRIAVAHQMAEQGAIAEAESVALQIEMVDRRSQALASLIGIAGRVGNFETAVRLLADLCRREDLESGLLGLAAALTSHANNSALAACWSTLLNAAATLTDETSRVVAYLQLAEVVTHCPGAGDRMERESPLTS
jgi:hypothetical protein